MKAELLELGYAQESVERYTGLLAGLGQDAAAVRGLGETLSGVLPPSVTENLAVIMDTVTAVAETEFTLAFDPTIRGPSSRSPWKASAAPWQAAAVMTR